MLLSLYFWCWRRKSSSFWVTNSTMLWTETSLRLLQVHLRLHILFPARIHCSIVLEVHLYITYSYRTCFGVCYCTEPGAPEVHKSNVSWSLRFSWSGAKLLIRQWPESMGVPELSPRDSSLCTEKEPSALRVLGQGLHEKTPNTWSLVTHQPL